MPPTPTECDLQRLQGTWRQVYFEENGIVNPVDDTATPGALTRFDAHAFNVRAQSGELLLHGTFELDASAAPRAITWIDSTGPDRGKRLAGIYQLDDDRFVFVAADEGAPRPRRFRAGEGQTLRAFKRLR